MNGEEDDPLRVTVTRPTGWKAREQQLPHIRERYEAGNPLALFDGIVTCERAELPLPGWLVKGLKSHLVESMTGHRKWERGRPNTPLGRQITTLKLHLRKGTLLSVRAWQKDRIQMWPMLPRKGAQMFFQGDFDAYGDTLGDAFMISSMILNGTFAEGSEESMKKAHRAPWPDFYINAALGETRVAFGLMDSDEGRPLDIPKHILAKMRSSK